MGDLRPEEISAINEKLRTLTGEFGGAVVGDFIASGGQARVYHLNLKDGKSSEKYVIKAFLLEHNVKNEDRRFRKMMDANALLAECGMENRISKIEREFDVRQGKAKINCIIEKYVTCLENYKAGSYNSQRDNVEIAVRIGNDLLPLLVVFEKERLLHRDIKPANIFLRGKDLASGLCLGDFGIVTHTKPDGGRTTVTIGGTYDTMSTDFIFGNEKKSDMFSLAATMYYYLDNGKFPFPVPFNKYGELIEDEWVGYRKKGCRKPVNGSVRLKELVCKALEFDPAKRFASCTEMLEELKKTEEYKFYIENENFGKEKTYLKKDPEDRQDGQNGGEKKPEQKVHSSAEDMNLALRNVGWRYRIQEFLGEGRRFVVYKALDVEENKTVAFKILKKQYSSNSAQRSKFKNDAQVLTTMSHPGIARIYKIGNSEGYQYMITEYVEGQPLSDYMKSVNKLDSKKTVRIGMQLLRALKYIHGKFLVHGNLRAEKIIIGEDGETVKIIDYDELRTATASAQNGELFFSTGNSLKAGELKDLSDVAGIMHVMLTGAKDVNLHNIVIKEIHPKRIESSVPETLDKVISKALSREYTSADEMMLELDKVHENKPPVKPQGTKKKKKSRFGQWLKRRKDVRIILFIMLVSLILSGIIFGVVAFFQAKIDSGKIGENIYYELYGDGKLVIDGYGELGDVKEHLGDKCSLISQVDILSGITSIADYTFEYMDGLWSVNVPDTVEYIGEQAFAYCDSLHFISLGMNAGNMADTATEGCRSLERISVDYNNPFYSTDENALYNEDETELIRYFSGKKDKSFSVPEGVLVIGDYAFSDSDRLKSVTVPDSVVKIGSYAFSNCDRLGDVTVSDSVLSIGTEAFGFTKLANDKNNWENGVLYAGNHAVDADPEGIGTSLTVRYGTVSIADEIFSFSSISNVDVPDTLKFIGTKAFDGTEYFKNTENRDESGVLYIGNVLVDADPEKVSGKYTVREGTKSVSAYAFDDCNKITGIEFPDSVVAIGDWAFDYLALESAVLPARVKYVGDHAFWYAGFRELKIPANTVYIGEGAIDNENLTAITVDENNAYFSSDKHGVLFNKDKIRLILYPAGNGRKTYTVPEGVTCIEAQAFEDSLNLEKITLPESVVCIGEEAFMGSGIKKINLPAGMLAIGENAFRYCDRLKEIKTEESKTSSVLSFTTDETGALFSGNGTVLVLLPDGLDIGRYEVSDETKIIKNGAFGYTYTGEVIIPESVEYIAEDAFWEVSAVRVDENNSCYASDNVGVLYSKGLDRLIYFPTGTEIKSYEIPNGVQHIAADTIWGKNLTDIYYSGTQESWENLANYVDINDNITVHYNS